MINLRVQPVPKADQIAFKAEAPVLRKALKAIKRDRQKQSFKEGKPDKIRGGWHPQKLVPISPDQLDTLHQRLTPIQERLKHWEEILMPHAPATLRNVWDKLWSAASFEAGEIKYLAQREQERGAWREQRASPSSL